MLFSFFFLFFSFYLTFLSSFNFYDNYLNYKHKNNFNKPQINFNKLQNNNKKKNYENNKKNIENNSENNNLKSNFNGKWIITLYKNCSHQEFSFNLNNYYNNQNKKNKPVIIHEYKHVLYGVSIKDIKENELKEIKCIKSYVKDTVRHLVSVPSWGLDRIDQEKLPLNNIYESTYTGANVDVYILDTGLDTNHVEFSAGSHQREVKNIYNAFITKPLEPGRDTDGHGHGTHVAGTIGGNTVGVAKGVNIYSLKILSDDGEGDSSDILHALDLVHTKGLASGRRSIMSMSLGGECEGSCEEDSLVLAVEQLYQVGILSSVASGNSGCNSCFGSPNSAPHAVTVGATNIDDDVTFFSNYGTCVDIFAPGYNIISSSPKKISGNEHNYVEMSGTSMACPHVTGVLALIMQKYPTASLDDIVKSLICDASKSQLHINSYDTTSRNLLLQVPINGAKGLEYCSHLTTCPNNCSNSGICLPTRFLQLPTEIIQPYQQIYINPNSTTCYCDNGYTGTSCENIIEKSCSGSSHKISITLYDSFGDGWSFGRFTITDFSGRTINSATDSLCDGSEDSRTYCLKEGKYIFAVDKGYFPQENEWKMCGINGGAQYTGVFTVDSKPHGTFYCKFICEGGARPLDPILMSSESGDGWSGAFYAIYSQSGVMLYGGTLLDGSSGVHHVCFPKSECTIMLIRLEGQSPSDLSYEVCGYTATSSEILHICVDEFGRCYVETEIPSTLANCPINSHPSITNHLSVSLFNFGLKKYSQATTNTISIKISSPTSKEILFLQNSTNTFLQSYDACLIDGCYDISITGYVSPSIIDYHPYGLWSMCGNKGELPLNSRFCINHDYQICYGFKSCPTLISYAHTSYQQFFVLYDKEKNTENQLVDTIVDIGHLHGVYEMCDLEDGDYISYFGVGKFYTINEITLCNTIIQIPSQATIHVTGNGTSCHLTDINSRICDSDKFPHDIMKLDEFGDGWGQHASYKIHEATGSKSLIKSGKMLNGQIEIDHLCLTKHKCYTFSLTATEYADEILWILCGYIGEAPIESLEFCVEENSCSFVSVPDTDYNKLEDDDFPVITLEPSFVPTSSFFSNSPTTPLITTLPSESFETFSPTSIPSLPTEEAEISLEPSEEPTSLPTSLPTLLPSDIPSIIPSNYPTLLPSLFPSIHDDDNVYDQPYKGVNSVYLLKIDINITFNIKLNNNTQITSLSLSSPLSKSKSVLSLTSLSLEELCNNLEYYKFLEYSIRKDVELKFIVWNSSYIPPSIINYDKDSNLIYGNIILSLFIKVPSDHFDFYSLKQSVSVSLQTDYRSNILQKILTITLLYQQQQQNQQQDNQDENNKNKLFPFNKFTIIDLKILPETLILSYISSSPSPYSSIFHNFNFTKVIVEDIINNENDDDYSNSGDNIDDISDYWDSHAWFALTVSGFTLLSIFLCYLCFLLFRCRVKRLNEDGKLPSNKTLQRFNKGYRKVEFQQADSGHNDINITQDEQEINKNNNQTNSPLRPSTEMVKRVGNKIIKDMKRGLRKSRRDVEYGGGFQELEGSDSDEDITLVLNEIVETNKEKQGFNGDGNNIY